MNLPYRMCQAVVKLFGTPAQMEKWGLEPGENVCDRLTALEANSGQEITVDRKTILTAWAGVRTDGSLFGATVTEDSEGQWTLTFNQPHPSGAGGWIYHGSGEEDQNRDNPKITLVDGSDTATGAKIMVTVDDNGAGADIFEDNDFSFTVYAECEVISQLYVDGVPASVSDLSEDESIESTDYITQGIQHAGFFNTDQMNAQLQIFNQATTAGVSNWEVRIEGANYDITSFTPTGATAGAIQQTSGSATGTYDYIIPMTGSIPGNNGNVQVAIVGTRHPQSTDTTASVTNTGIYV